MQAKPAPSRPAQFIIKVSKLCNLRCSYCYEYAELGDRTVMTPGHLERMYSHIADYYASLDTPTAVKFIWHGGEPLLQDPEIYWSTFARQRAIFGPIPQVRVTNVLQTNLTVLDDERLRLLRDGFDSVGVSVDLFGGLRVNLAGKDSQQRVLGNLDVLRREGIQFAGITVLTRRNLAHIKEIFRFYERLGASFRLLPLFPGAYEDQHAGYEITAKETLEALCAVTDLWLQSSKNISIAPVTEHVRSVIRYLTPGMSSVFYSRREWETATMVNTSGDVFAYAEAYDPDYCYGNIFTTPLRDLLASGNRERSLQASELRMAASCTKCPYFGACSGYDTAERANHFEDSPRWGDIRLCTVERGLLRHIERRLRETGLFGDVPSADLDRLRAERLTAEDPALQAVAFAG